MLRELLKGLEGRQPQTVANMSIIPLVAQDTEVGGIGTVADIYLNRDKAYELLEMGNTGEMPTIMPSGYTLLTKEQAQDRTIKSKQIIPAKGKIDAGAFCVQSSQCGHMHDNAKTKVRMLPMNLRKECWAQRNAAGYSDLWSSLGAYNSSRGIQGDFLKSYFEKYTQQLSEFIAEFELVDHQRGAIVIINDEVIGVELSANPIAFSAQWELLIRDCYGSEAVSMQGKQTVSELDIIGDAATLEDLAVAVKKADDAEYDFAEQHVMGVLGQSEIMGSPRQTVGGMQVVDVETQDFVGQAVKKNGSIIDITLLRRNVAERGFRMRR